MKIKVKKLALHSLVPLALVSAYPTVIIADNSIESDITGYSSQIDYLNHHLNDDIELSTLSTDENKEFIKITGLTLPEHHISLTLNDSSFTVTSDINGNFSIDVPISTTDIELQIMVLDEDSKTVIEDAIPIEASFWVSTSNGTQDIDDNSNDKNEPLSDDNSDLNKKDSSVEIDVDSNKVNNKKTPTLTAANRSIENAGNTAYIIYASDFKNITGNTDVLDNIVTRLNKELSIKTSKKDIIKWNSITDVKKLKEGDILFIDGYRPVKFDENSKKPYNNSQEFLNFIAPFAQKNASENNMYASIMIAQAIKETGWGNSDLAQAPFYNLFGIKASSSDELSVIKETWEVDNNGNSYMAIAPFKVFNSYHESFLGNKDKIRNGVSWDPIRYSGSWLENAKYYSDASKSLTGRYAMDPNYHIGLNDLIERYKLTKYDTHPVKTIKSKKTISHKIRVSKSGFTIDNIPYQTKNFNTVDYSSNHLNKYYTAVKEAQTENGTYLLLKSGDKTIGWIDKEATTNAVTTISSKSVYYEATIIGNNHNLFSAPARTEGAVRLGFSSNYKGASVKVLSEKVTTDGTFALVSHNDQQLGWINTLGINPSYDTVQKSEGVSYNAIVLGNGHNIFSAPAGTKGSTKISNSSNFRNSEVTVLAERTTSKGTFAEIRQNGKIVGWINTLGIKPEYLDLKETNGVSYRASIKANGHNIYSNPAWTKNSIKVANTNDYRGHTFTVYTEKVTEYGTYAQVKINHDSIGWVDVKGIQPEYLSIESTRNVAYSASIKANGHNFFSSPAWTEGSSKVADARDFKGLNVNIFTEVDTAEGTYVEVKHDGETIGWIDKLGIEPTYQPIQETRGVSYRAAIKGNGHNIYSAPAWTEGSVKLANTNDYRGEEFTVYTEKVTPNGTFALVKIRNLSVGWVDTKGIQPLYSPILEQNLVSYDATIKANGHNLFSAPAWTEGSSKIANATDYKNFNVKIYKQVITPDGTYGEVKYNGKTLGWMNTIGLTMNYLPIEATNVVSYQARIIGNGHNIYSRPAGTENSIKIADSNEYANQAITIRQEIVTPNGRYFLATKNKQEIGWILYKGVRLEKPLVYIDPGHGGEDPGAIADGINEKDINLSVAKQVEEILLNKGYYVVMSRKNDSTLSLSDRAQEANQLNADIYVSIHQNAFNKTTSGIETYYYNERGNTENHLADDSNRINNSQKLAEEIHKELIAETGARDRGVRRANFHVVRETEMPAVLIESGYLDNAADRAKLLLKSYQEKIAQAIANGIEKFYKLFN